MYRVWQTVRRASELYKGPALIQTEKGIYRPTLEVSKNVASRYLHNKTYERMLKETHFDEDFYWENLNDGFYNISKCFHYQDWDTLFQNTIESRHEYVLQMGSVIWENDRIQNFRNMSDQPSLMQPSDSIVGYHGPRDEIKIFKHLFIEDPYSSLIFSDKIECELVSINEFEKVWLISVFAITVDEVAPIPEFLPEAEIKNYAKLINPLAQTYLQKFTMAYELGGVRATEWDPTRFKFYKWDIENPRNPSHVSLLGVGQRVKLLLKSVENIEFDNEELAQ